MNDNEPQILLFGILATILAVGLSIIGVLSVPVAALVPVLYLLAAVAPRLVEVLSERAHQDAAETTLRELGDDVPAWPAWTLHATDPMVRTPALALVSQLEPELHHQVLSAAHPTRTLAQVMIDVGFDPDADDREREVVSAAHHQLSVEYGEVLTDPYQQFAALEDVSDPLTAEFLDAYTDLNAAADGPLEEYFQAHARARAAWDAALAHARDVSADSPFLAPPARPERHYE